jgi:phenylacetate-CoA ligase
LRYRLQRYSRAFAQELAFLEATEFSSPLQLELLQLGRLRRMLHHAVENVPAYHGKLSAAQIASLKPGRWAALHELPLTEKSSLRQDSRRYYPSGKIPAGSIPWSTSGTTGTPLTIHYSPDAVARQYAFVESYRRQAGVSRHMRRAQFTGKLVAPANEKSVFWRYDWANRCLLLSTVHLTPENIPAYLRALQQFQPQYISGYPSAITLLAKFVIERPELSLPLKAVLTSAETLQDEQRLQIGSAFGSRVYDQYGQTEMQSFWFECRYGRMHAHPLFGVTEILRPNGEPCKAGEVGDVVLTGLVNSAMPLLRYRVGDRAAWSDESSCPCGRHLPIVAAIEGRKDDYIYSQERGLIGRMDPVLKGVSGILECQFVQETADSLDIRFVPGEDFQPEHLRLLQKNLEERLGRSLKYRFHKLASIPRGPNGKFRTVVSRINTSQQNYAEEVTR